MAIPKILGGQTDFSGGEFDPEIKRDDTLMKTGGRQCSNFRILNSKKITNRPGKSALLFETGRVDKVTMSPNNNFYIAFGTGYLHVYNAAGAQVYATTIRGDTTPIPWTAATAKNIVWDFFRFSIYITYADGAPNNVPQILTWDGVSQTSTWQLTTYAINSVGGYGSRSPFYHISPQNVFLWPNSGSGAGVTLTASAAIFSASWVGARINFAYRQMVVTGYVSTTQLLVTVVSNTLPNITSITWTGFSAANWSVGQLVEGSVSQAFGIIVEVTAGVIKVISTTQTGFLTNDTLVSATGESSGTLTIAGVTYGSVSTAGISLWDDEAMNNFRGWPTSCFVDQGRLGFCNFPAVPGLIAWSAINVFGDLYTDPQNAAPSNAILEIVPNKSQALYVKGGMEGSEFVFCDNAIYYIPITAAIPLKPGSVAFNQISARGIAPVQPRAAEQSIVYIKSGSAEVGVIQAPGAYYRPYVIDNISENHAHLFTASPAIAIAIPAGSTQFEELYLYILRADGVTVVGKYAIKNGLIETGSNQNPGVGWTPWSGVGASTWISAFLTSVIFTTAYPLGVNLVEVLDNTQVLDMAIPVNNLPVALTAPAGKGPLWFMAGQTVSLFDGARPMGTYASDANGNIIPQGIGGENLASANLIAGRPWTATFEPFTPDANSGNSVHQRMFRRRVSRMAVYFMNSTGFLMARLFSGPITRTSPALGTIMNIRRIDTYNQDDDATKAPPLREGAERWRPRGRSYDARVAVIKDTPGPLLIAEIGMEVSI